MGLTVEVKSFPALAGVHGGSGAIKNAAHVVDPNTVAQDINSQVQVLFVPYSIQVMSCEIAIPSGPNWFGVGFRDGLTRFDTVNLFCHPNPSFAGMKDGDYQTRSGEWPRLFRYAEIMGRQMAMAVSNHIVIIPFFDNASWSGGGHFVTEWQDIVEQILKLVRQAAVAAKPSPTPGKLREHFND